MPITISCPHCQVELRLSDAMAGKRGACRSCGGTLQVPDSTPGEVLPPNHPLEQATLNEIVAEIARRGYSAVLTLLDTEKPSPPSSDSTVLALLGSDTQLDFGVRHFTTEPMTDDRLEQLFRLFAELSVQKRSGTSLTPDPTQPTEATPPPQQAKTSAVQAATGWGNTDSPTTPPTSEVATSPALPLPDNGVSPSDSACEKPVGSEPAPLLPERAPEAFTLKGDPLGMTLAEFKMKHERSVEGRRARLPWCSSETPGVDVPALMSLAWHSSVGIVHARTELPVEGRSPTIAGVETDLLIYQFVDEQLFQITGFFPTDSFHTVADALRQKFGDPQSETDHPRQMVWWSLDTSIELTYGRVHPREPSVIRYYHDALIAEAGQRQPDHSQDL